MTTFRGKPGGKFTQGTGGKTDYGFREPEHGATGKSATSKSVTRIGTLKKRLHGSGPSNYKNV